MIEYKLPELPYSYDAIEPYIDEKTLRLHHNKHHQGYVNGLNSTLKVLRFQEKGRNLLKRSLLNFSPF